MKKLLTLALALVILALGFVTPPFRATKVMAQSPPPMQTIVLNTGYDQWLAPPAKIAPGQKDNEWRVMKSPPNDPPAAPPSTGRPADVVDDIVWFQCNPSLHTNFPQSNWISFAPNAGLGSSVVDSYKYNFYFSLPPGIQTLVGFGFPSPNPLLKMKLSADDHITDVALNGSPLFHGSGGIFCDPPLVIDSSLLSGPGASFNFGPTVNVITVTVGNTVPGTITGLVVDGTVTYAECGRAGLKDSLGMNGSITFWESTFVLPTQHTFAAMGPELTTRMTGPLGSPPVNSDFQGVPGEEFYDVFYSDWNGDPNANGQFVTIEAVWDQGAPFGGGLNISRVDIHFDVGFTTSADSVTSFVALGDNAMPDMVVNAVDSDPLTDTTMGNTIGQTQRLRVTLGFLSCAFVRIRDDGNPAIAFLGNWHTGAYQFSCSGTTYTGVAQVTKRGNITTFQQNGPGRRMTATIDGGAFKGSASLQSPPGTIICTITDKDTRDD